MDNSNTSGQLLGKIVGSLFLRRNAWLGIILVSALIGFEAFNYSTTFTALNDLLGDMRFANIRWATILALAFSSIDFAGIARMFSSDQEETAGKEVWYLFVAWLLAATLNAMLTWWGVSLALVNHTMASASMIEPGTLTRAVPIFVAIMVWVTRILLISTISSSGSRFLSSADAPAYYAQPSQTPVTRPQVAAAPTRPQVATARPAVDRAPATSHPATVAARHAEARPTTVNNSRPVSTNNPRPAPATSRPTPPARAPQPLPGRPPARSQRPQPPMPEPPPEEEEKGIAEPEYIPDPSFLPSQSAFHSLSARGAKGNGSTRN